MARSACVPVPHVVGSRALELRLVAGSMADPVGERYAAAILSDRADSLAIRAAPALPIIGHGLCKNARSNAMVVRARTGRRARSCSYPRVFGAGWRGRGQRRGCRGASRCPIRRAAAMTRSVETPLVCGPRRAPWPRRARGDAEAAIEPFGRAGRERARPASAPSRFLVEQAISTPLGPGSAT